ncbi:MAG: threonine--tRNA ligase [Pseudobdellovibrionaceae bacterium]
MSLPSKPDHRDIGKILSIFDFDSEVGAGLPLWLPNGTVIRDELEKMIKELEFQEGYKRVSTPHLAKSGLYKMSGHLPFYEESMFPALQLEEEQYYLRPMNCPHHHRIYSKGYYSYRDLPVRFAEYGQAYRYERSGALSGLMRARGLCQNDAHIYCREDQIGSELLNVMSLYKNAYAVLGLSGYRFRLSKGDPENKNAKYVDSPLKWRWAEDLLRECLVRSHVEFVEENGEAAFYGPKIDIQMKNALGHEETISTIQLDFVSAERMDLRYKDESGNWARPFVIHRAPLGSHERMVATLLEQNGGAFPAWLSPVQINILAIAQRHENFCDFLNKKFRMHGFRSEVDVSNNTLQKKLRQSFAMKTPYTIIVGDNEMKSEVLSFRKRGEKLDYRLSIAEFISALSQEIQSRDQKLKVGK